VKAAGIPYRVPPDHELPERLGGVLHVIHLVYTEGHVATTSDELVRADLCQEAIRLARLVVDLVRDEAEAYGLLALLLLTDARRSARTTADGTAVSLEDQDRSRWDREAITEGDVVLDHALSMGRPGPFQVQAAVAALHAQARIWEATDWVQIAALYGELERLAPSPGPSLSRSPTGLTSGCWCWPAWTSTNASSATSRSTRPGRSSSPDAVTPTPLPMRTARPSPSPTTPPSGARSRFVPPASDDPHGPSRSSCR
jgi:hypothetical protein